MTLATLFTALTILVTTAQKPASGTVRPDGVYFADFGKDTYGQLEISYRAGGKDSVVVRFGERLAGDMTIDRNPPGTVRFAEYRLSPGSGDMTCRIRFRPDPRNGRIDGNPDPQGQPPILMDPAIGEVLPFRYVEVEGAEVLSLTRHMVHVPFNDAASSFVSSDSTLNAVWEMCKHTMKATTFCGVYVDGDRERIPYEADALINALGHYGTDADYRVARRTMEVLLEHPNWPTEWHLQMPLLAWDYYMYSGDLAALQENYDKLVERALLRFRDSTGLITTTGQKAIRDIVDWPRVWSKNPLGADDHYALTKYNTVVNAFHAASLRTLAKIARAIGKEDEAIRFSRLADETAEALNALFFDPATGTYLDGSDTDHRALHATMFPLALGLIPKASVKDALRFIEGKGMVCSVYGAHFLLEGLYEYGDAGYALSLMTSHGECSWYNMIREGATMTMEAWGQKYKPNQDWNHAWGAAPASAIPHRLMGVRPLEPGGTLVEFRPQPGGLEFAEALVPMKPGGVKCSFRRGGNGKYTYSITVPEGMRARIVLPGRKPVEKAAGTYTFRNK